MRNVNMLTRTMVAFAALGLCFPSVAMSSTPVAKPKVVDVALLDGNVLVGQLVDANGPVPNKQVVLQRQDQTVAALKTNKDGVFAAKGVPAGVYRVASNDAQGVYRLWTPKTAPPNAQPGALLVSGNNVVRAQHARCLRNLLANPWVVAGIVAAAIAIPVALHNAGHDTPVSP